MGDTGFEQVWKLPENMQGLPESGTVFGDLSVIVEAWEGLPVALRAGILAMVKSAEKTPGDNSGG